MFDLHGQVAAVTGASAGLGRQFAMALARQGANLVLMSAERRSRTLSPKRSYGRRALRSFPSAVT